MRFDQSICKSYRNSDIQVKRHSDIDYRNNDGMEDIERTPFGRRLFEARTEARNGKGYTQAEAAGKVGMMQSTLSEAEISGKRSGFTSQLASLYGVSATWLATGKGKKHHGVLPRMEHLTKMLLENPDISEHVIEQAIKNGNSLIELLKKAKSNGTQ